VKKVYVQPAWMLPNTASQIAMGDLEVTEVAPPMRRESEENVDYKAGYEEAQDKIRNLETRIAELELMFQNRNKQKPVPSPVPARANNESPAAESGEEVAMSLEVKRPVIDVTVRRYTLELSDDNTQGRLAVLLSEGFLDQPRRIQDLYPEFRARGWMKQTGAPTPLNLPLAKLAEMGFLRMVGANTYQSVPGMKVRVREVEAA
jgi:hypothetical protein